MNLINAFDAPIYKFETIDSTNKYAKNLCNTNPKTGTIIISNEQTNGRGRFGNSWESSKNNGLYYSIIFRKEFENLKYETLTLFICLGITKLLEDYSISSNIKWPNDILINHKKVCGILCESISNTYGEFIIAGIGINLYHNKNDFPNELREKATSLKLNTPKIIIKNYFINSFTNYLFKYYNYFLSNNFENFLHEYTDKSYLLNKKIYIKLNENEVNGTVYGFNNFGHLLLKTDNEIISINSGEISLKNVYKNSGH